MNEIEKLKQENAELKRQLKSQRLQNEFDIGTVKFTEQETHCIARLLQGAVYGEDFLSGCSFCKFQCSLVNRDKHSEKIYSIKPRWRQILDKLTQATGVDCGIMDEGNLYGSNFPYKRFLKNSNAEAKEYFRNYFTGKIDGELHQ